MSELPQVHVPQWDLADRMRKALRDADISVQEMADYLGVNRNTVSNWINGHTSTPKAALRLWSMRCGVPFEWLKDGIGESAGPPGGGIVNPCFGRAHRMHGFRKVKRRSTFAPMTTPCSLVPVAA